MNFDARTITESTFNAVQKHIARKAQSFEKEYIYNVSRAVGPLAIWVQAILGFSQVLISIAPLTNRLQNLKNQLVSIQKEIEVSEKVLLQLNEEVVVLKENFKKRTQESQLLKDGIAKSEKTLSAAQSLVGKLGDEKVRWQEQIERIHAQFAQMPFDALLSAGFITFLSEKPEDVRAALSRAWAAPLSPQFDFLTFMTSESVLLSYKQKSLPDDTLSLQNSVMVLSHATPLLIDPNHKATEWLQQELGDAGLL